MFYTQTKFTTIPKKIINLDLYVDEFKNRTYTRYDEKTETITYIMILAVPKDKKVDLYQKLNNSRCLNEEEHIFEKCNNNCRFHCENDGELHYTEIQKKNNVKYKIANKGLDILSDNNLNYDKVIIDNIFYDKTTEMELHPYFNTNAIKQIRMKELLEENKRIFFETNEIEFIDSDHHNGDTMNSQFIHFVDIILGTTLNVIHNSATNSAKKLSFKIKPLVERILSDNGFAKKKSHYNFFYEQSISYFPIISKENFEKDIKKYYSKEINFDKLLENNNYFSNTKPLLLKEETGQISFFD